MLIMVILFAGIYTRVTEFVNWIESYVKFK